MWMYSAALLKVHVHHFLLWKEHSESPVMIPGNLPLTLRPLSPISPARGWRAGLCQIHLEPDLCILWTIDLTPGRELIHPPDHEPDPPISTLNLTLPRPWTWFSLWTNRHTNTTKNITFPNTTYVVSKNCVREKHLKETHTNLSQNVLEGKERVFPTVMGNRAIQK